MTATTGDPTRRFETELTGAREDEHDLQWTSEAEVLPVGESGRPGPARTTRATGTGNFERQPER